MYMRVVWGKTLPGQWDAFEAAFGKALEIRGEAKGLTSQWLLRNQNDPDAGVLDIAMGERRGHARILGQQTAL